MWGSGSRLVLWKMCDAVALGGRARGGWVRVLSRVPSSSRPARRSSGCIFARWGHRRCLYPRGLGTRPPGGWVRGRWGSSRVSVRRGHRRCLYPCGPGTRPPDGASGPGGSGSPLFLSVRWVGLLGPRPEGLPGFAGPARRGRSDWSGPRRAVSGWPAGPPGGLWG